MSYGVSQALQAAVYQTLSSDSAVAALVGAAIYDQIPAGAVPPLYVSLGPETVLDRSDRDTSGAEHRFVVSVVSDAAGFATAKAAAVAVSDALQNANMSLSRGQLIFLNFDRAVAKRDTSANLRRIDLRFRARVEDF